ncbi:MAG: sel1 repeat family protein [Magnetococcales bacterium]|nr:sel1 repeat family protein [Magnetococcales bacterium]
MIKKFGLILTVLLIGTFAVSGVYAKDRGETFYSKGNFQFSKKEYRKAAMWYSRAAKKGSAPALYKLGLLSARGLGTKLDKRKAAWWYEQSAELGFHPAMYELGKAYSQGRGVRRNLVKAYMWFHLAGEAGSKVAPRYLQKLNSTMDKRDIVKALREVDDRLGTSMAPK